MSTSSALERGGYGGSFLFEVDGIEIGNFFEVAGLAVEVGVEDVEEGGQNEFVHKLPGRMTWPNIVLKRGVTQSDNLFAWVQTVSGDGLAKAGNKVERKTAAVTLLSGNGDRIRAWQITGALPVRWTGPSFATTSGDAASEELEITHHGFRTR